MSSLEDGHLKGEILSILSTDRALNMVNFRVGQFVIGTMHFQILSGYISIGRCHCKVDAAGVMNGAAAEYNAKSNTITTRDSRIRDLDDKVSLVHEATHAVIDLMGGINKSLSVTSLETETCAYLAGAMYKLATTQAQKGPVVKVIAFSKERDIHVQADKLVSAKGLGVGNTNAGVPISFTALEIGALQSAIKANPIYSNWKNKVLTDGI